jgi:hypothetical protein
MTQHLQPHTNEQIARMLEMSCEYPDIENNCAGCEYCPTSGMRKGCCDFGNDDIVRMLRSRPYQSEQDKVLDEAEGLAEHYYKAYLDGDPYLEKKDFKKMIAELRQQGCEQG